jgi:polyisoprenoid-binding protein YceI
MMQRVIVLIAACAALPVHADECHAVDGLHGVVSFEVKQAGSPFRGKFKQFGGEVCLLANRVTRIEVWLEPASVDAGLPEIDAALRDKDFFAVGQYPRAVYSSQTAEVRGNEQFVRGTLQMKGRRRNLDVPFSLGREGDQQIVSGTLTLNRLDYGIGTGEWSNTRWLGGEVRVDFKAALAAPATSGSVK